MKFNPLIFSGFESSSSGSSATPGGGEGAVQFNEGGAFSGDENQLFWDNASKKLGIGTNTPNDSLTVLNGGGTGITHTNGTQILSTYVDGSGVWIGSISNDTFSIFVNNGGASLEIAADNSQTKFYTPNVIVETNLYPQPDNTGTLGNASHRWLEVHSSALLNSGDLNIYTTGANNPRSIYIQSNLDGDFNNDVNSGDIQLLTRGVGGVGQSGLVRLVTGTSQDTSSGQIILETGYSSNAISGGITITTGAAQSNAFITGAIDLYTGPSLNGTSGDLRLRSGFSTQSGQTGDVTLGSGDINSGGASGNTIIKSGEAPDGGVRGDILLQNGTEGTIGHAWLSTGTSGEGGWSALTPTSLSSLGAATTSHTIDNANNAQIWNWNSLASGTGLQLGTSNTSFTGKLIEATSTGSNSGVTGSLISSTVSGILSAATGMKVSHAGTNAAARGLVVNMTGGSGSGKAIDVDVASANTGDTPVGINVNMSGGSGSAQTGLVVSCSSSSAIAAASFNVANGAFGGPTVLSRSNHLGYSYQAIASVAGVKDIIKLTNDRSPTDGQGTQIIYSALRSGGTDTTVAGIAGLITDTTASAYKGALIFSVANNTTPDEKMRIKHDGSLNFPATNTAGGTTGNQTINKISGTVNFDTLSTSLTVTNSLVTANSLVFAVIRTNDATAQIKNVVPSSGSFTINLTATPTAETSVGFWVINQ